MYALTNSMAEIVMMSRATKGRPIKWKQKKKKTEQKHTNKTGFVELVEIQRSYSDWLSRDKGQAEKKRNVTLLERSIEG